MPTLHDLTSERLALQRKLEELDFDQQTITDTLEGESTALQEKVESYGYVIKNMESFVESIKAEEDRIAKRRKIYESRVGHIKEWLKTNMIACGITKIECPAFTIAVKQNPPSVVIDMESQIPEGYMRLPEPLPWVANKKLIAEAIKAGMDVPGCRLVQTQRVEIK